MIDYLKSRIKDFIDSSAFFTLDDTLEKESITLNITKPKIEQTIPLNGVDTDSIIYNLVYTEIIHNIIKKISVEKIEYLDFSKFESDIVLLDYNSNVQIVESILSENYRNMIIGTSMVETLSDHYDYRYNDTNVKNSLIRSFNRAGKIRDRSIFIDSYIRYDDYSILLFDNIRININIEHLSEDDNEVFVYYKLSVKPDKIKNVKVLTNTRSVDYSTYNLSKRKDKLNKI